MQTQVLSCDDAGLRGALELLHAGHPIAFPTDTVYGVGADGLSADAVATLYEAKQRPLTQAIPLLIGDAGQLEQVASAVPPLALRLAERFWPGGLTLVVPAAAALPSVLLAGGSTVAVRLPDHAWLRALISALGRPLAATSANLHGGPNPATADAVFDQLGGLVPLLIDGGPTAGDVPSTIVDLTTPAPRVLRAGVIAAAELEELLAG